MVLCTVGWYLTMDVFNGLLRMLGYVLMYGTVAVILCALLYVLLDWARRTMEYNSTSTRHHTRTRTHYQKEG